MQTLPKRTESEQSFGILKSEHAEPPSPVDVADTRVAKANLVPRVSLLRVIRSVAPFLFAKKRKSRTVAAVATHPQAVKHVTSKQRVVHHAHKTAHHPVLHKAPAPTSETPASDEPVSVEPAAPAAHQDGSPHGKILSLAPDEKVRTREELVAEKEELIHEKGWMEKVAATEQKQLQATKRSAWAMFTERFRRAPKTDAVVAPIAGESAGDIRSTMNEDLFLQHVQGKKTDSVVGTATDDPSAPPPPDLGIRPGKQASTLEDFASGTQSAPAPSVQKTEATEESKKGKIISSAELKKEADAAKDASRRILEETKKEMKEEQTEEEKKIAPKKEEAPEQPVHAKKVIHKESNGFQKFAAAMNHFGLGKERMRFTENLATMLNAGLPLVDALQTLRMEIRNKQMKKIINRIVDTVENGSPLWRAMDAENLFSLHAIALVRIGEEAGSLAENMEYLAAQETKDHELVQKVKMAMIYPSIVLSIMFVIVMGLGLFVLPNLIGVLTSLNVKLPFVTRCIIAFSNAFSEHGAVIVPGSIGSIILLVILAKFTRLKVVAQWVTFRIPGIGALLRTATIARFGVILGGLLKAGVPVVEAMQSLVQVTSIVVYKRFYEKMQDHITVGDSFAKTFSSIHGSEKLLPVSVQQLVITGEKSGALADIMLKVANIYDKKASETAQKLPVILEPILLLIIGSLVGTIALGIIVPIYSIVGSVGQ